MVPRVINVPIIADRLIFHIIINYANKWRNIIPFTSMKAGNRLWFPKRNGSFEITLRCYKMYIYFIIQTLILSHDNHVLYHSYEIITLLLCSSILNTPKWRNFLTRKTYCNKSQRWWPWIKDEVSMLAHILHLFSVVITAIPIFFIWWTRNILTFSESIWYSITAYSTPTMKYKRWKM